MAEGNPGNGVERLYGINVFGAKAMKKHLRPKAFQKLKKIIDEGGRVPPDLADEVAGGMMEWAVSKGATHYTHWFLPLTGLTAEKHDAFIDPDPEGGVRMSFGAKSLIQGEPDASSFPSGGLRATFEARGYTAWDPTSPAFIKYRESGPTLAIPTAFCSYNGEALDKKTPLLRSMRALSDAAGRLLDVFGMKAGRPYATLGAEQEYFLIDREFYLLRPDLIQTGRTLFGNPPAKHQQLSDHYFGAIRERVIAFMDEFDRECWKLGIPSKTRHNEVSPAQYEIAPVFENLNLSTDHNMMIMELLKTTAEKHGFVCLLHEKPFAGVNGSGKHNNWSIAAPGIGNLFDPAGDGRLFMSVICACIMAVDRHARLLRASVASAGNDHRLGANEAPPAIMSVFLGEELTGIIGGMIKGSNGAVPPKAALMSLGADSLSDLPRDLTDRNRTSPFAFTGTKFEFRAVGSSHSCAGVNVVLNTIVSEALDHISDRMEPHKGKKSFDRELSKVLGRMLKRHGRVIFNGDNYSPQWVREAKKRGLPNIKSSDEALKAIVSKKTMALFERYKVLNERELESRYNTYLEAYAKSVTIEAQCAKEMAKTMFLPAAIGHQMMLSKALKALKGSGVRDGSTGVQKQSKIAGRLIDRLTASIGKSEKALAKKDVGAMISSMHDLRCVVDALEQNVEDSLWPVPKYQDMLLLA